MTYLGALAVGLAVQRGVQTGTDRRTAALLAAAATCGVALPGLALPIGLIGLSVWVRKEFRKGRSQKGEGTGLLGRTLLIGLSAGLPLGAGPGIGRPGN